MKRSGSTTLPLPRIECFSHLCQTTGSVLASAGAARVSETTPAPPAFAYPAYAYAAIDPPLSALTRLARSVPCRFRHRNRDEQRPGHGGTVLVEQLQHERRDGVCRARGHGGHLCEAGRRRNRSGAEAERAVRGEWGYACPSHLGNRRLSVAWIPSEPRLFYYRMS